MLNPPFGLRRLPSGRAAADLAFEHEGQGVGVTNGCL
jgi:hypothetical protein